MPAVVISRSLRLSIGDTPATQIATDFLEYKTGAASYGDVFGRDKPHSWPQEVVDHELWHVHLETSSVVSAWDSLWNRSFPQENFTSDKILVYGHLWDVHLAPWMLLTILNPNGHDLMNQAPLMRALAVEYAEEKQEYSRNPMKDQWIIVQSS